MADTVGGAALGIIGGLLQAYFSGFSASPRLASSQSALETSCGGRPFITAKATARLRAMPRFTMPNSSGIFVKPRPASRDPHRSFGGAAKLHDALGDHIHITFHGCRDTIK